MSKKLNGKLKIDSVVDNYTGVSVELIDARNNSHCCNVDGLIENIAPELIFGVLFWNKLDDIMTVCISKIYNDYTGLDFKTTIINALRQDRVEKIEDILVFNDFIADYIEIYDERYEEFYNIGRVQIKETIQYIGDIKRKYIINYNDVTIDDIDYRVADVLEIIFTAEYGKDDEHADTFYEFIKEYKNATKKH